MQKLLSRADLKSRSITYTNPHLIRMERTGRFPKRVVFSSQRVFWVAEEVDAWLAAKIAARDASDKGDTGTGAA